MWSRPRVKDRYWMQLAMAPRIHHGWPRTIAIETGWLVDVALVVASWPMIAESVPRTGMDHPQRAARALIAIW